MKFAVLMNPLSSLHIKKDTSLAFMASAEARGWDCFYFTLEHLVCRDGEAYAFIYQLKNLSNSLDSIQEIALGMQPLAQFDMILMRQDPPFNLEYIYATYALELTEKHGVLVANKPQSLRDMNEKMAILQFPSCCVPTLVTRNLDALHDFWASYQQVIFKPLDGMGGRGIFYVDQQGVNLVSILEALTKKGQGSIMAQRFIPEIKTGGDKRILLLDGQPVPYALARIPKSGEIRGNLAAGGHGAVVPINANDRRICSEIAPMLREKALSFVGIDIIGDYLTEINVTSPTCLREITAATQLDIAGDYLDLLLQHLKNNP